MFGGGRIGPTVLVVIGLLMAAGYLATLWTDLLWFTEAGYRQVLTTRLLTQAALFVIAGGLSGLLVWSSLWLAYRHRPVYAPASPEQENLDRYRAALEPVRRLVFVGVPVVLGLFAGSAGAAQWQTVLLWLNRQPFGQTDPEFGIDIGFFVFTVPWLEVLVSFATLVLGLAVIAALLTHYVYGGLQLQGPGQRTTPQARVHLAVLLALLIAVRGVAYWLERYTLMTTQHERITGMTYTDVNAVLPTRGVLAIAALLCAAFFVATIWTKAWRLPIIGLVGLVVIAVVVGGIYPSLIQSLRVRPSEAALEEPYIQRAIDATLQAYQLEDSEVQPYNAETEATPGQLRDDAATIPGIRIVDPSIVSPTFRQLQGVRNYYQFPDALDVDRYELDGETVDTVVAVRELNLDGVSEGQRNWVNDHTVYTHGFGLVAAYGNQRSSGGEPIFYQRNIPPEGELGDFEPRIYFGEYSPTYSIVGAPEDATPQELDYPDSESETGETRNTYQGDGGVPIGSTLRQLAYAIKYRQVEILLSEQVNSESQILDHREPRERVERVAPWLRLDGNPYPAVVGDRIKWIVDGYTVTAEYPYSQMQQLGTVTTDALVTGAQNVRSIGGGDVNYIRNSVKATVDAFDGSVDLYAWDEEDPILQAWSSAFEGTVQPMSEISGELMGHLRYPEDMFKVQREIMSRYHVESAAAFFGGQDFWQVSEDPSASGDSQVSMPPYYLSIAMPGQEEPTFSLTSTFIPQGERQNLVGYMAVDADAGDQSGQRRDGYGQVRMLELPRDTTVMGPGQFQNEIESSNVNSEAFSPTLSQFLSLNRQQGSNVQIGNLLTLPVGGGLLYVEPVYVSAATGSSFPLQRVVVVAFGNDLAWSDTLDGALDELFGGDSGATAPDEGTGAEEPIDPGEAPGGQPGDDGAPADDDEQTEEPGGEPTGDLAGAIADIEEAYQDGKEALREGDWSGYAEAQERLQEAIDRAIQSQPEGSVSLPGGDDAEQTEAP
ncbi:UPF0182 family membrane protein [Ornithinicoccus halotolerans]|uniref:UPF0182 family membrane protein n=1 Tax=Ornithinicoccus halotolerans TaxID=1748220 RepID=UPI001885FC19|nr:UPF0182 family protein [Ornithinicoccus halotolerans]